MVWSQLSLPPDSWSYTPFSFLETIVGGSEVKCVYSLSPCRGEQGNREETAGVFLGGRQLTRGLGFVQAAF